MPAFEVAIGAHRGAVLAVECFARAVAATAPNPRDVLVSFESALAVLDQELARHRISKGAHEEQMRAMRSTADLLRRELARRLA